MVLIGLTLAAISIFGMFALGDFARLSFELIAPFIMAILIPTFFIFLYIKLGHYLFCGDCHYTFRTKKD
ncbi:hypothetical protein [Staphylococcus succinus]|uniref:hypothetical protein n=1 Tax=Staphylococcus succinus TaxID=61015 RepID=UPI001C712723|nr:hypothetical protein [Staphylococcus succinus]